MSDRPVRPGTPRPVPVAGGTVPAVRPARRHGSTAPPLPSDPRSLRRRPSTTAIPDLGLRRIASGVLVVVLVIATIWVERDRHEPVAGYGVLDARGVAMAPLVEGVAVGEPAPAFRLQDTDGDILALADLAGQPVVLQFWTTWCLDCVDAIPIFQQVATTHGDQVTVLGIAPEETAGRTTGALDRAGATYVTLLDTAGTVAERYGATPLPLTVVIDGAGQIVAMHEGRVSVSQLETDLAPLLP